MARILRLLETGLTTNSLGYVFEFLDVHLSKKRIGGIEAQVARHLMHRDYSAVLVPDGLRVVDAVRAQHLGPIFAYGVNTDFLPLADERFDGAIDISFALEERQPIVGRLDTLLSHPLRH
ncbi:hypothetical protein HY637_02355 [Candidatus Woesearchaeota archaeon]|nr:hypothetical protein [Candidatus Woesearchaeota archaeon]